MYSDINNEEFEDFEDDFEFEFPNNQEDTADNNDNESVERSEIEEIEKKYEINPEGTEPFREMVEFSRLNDENAEDDDQKQNFEQNIHDDVTQKHVVKDQLADPALKNTIDFDGESESLWQEVIEENSLPGFKIETVHQFRSFIKVGARILHDLGELKHDQPLSDDQKAMVADLGQFINVYGSFERWKEEKNRLIKDHNDAVNDLKTLYQKHMQVKRRLELTLSENAKLIEKYDEFEESMRTFQDMKTRNVYLESEIKKINALLGFTDLDLTEEFKKNIADTKTLDISARFLHKAWKKANMVMSAEKVIIPEVLRKLSEILNKPFNASKLRLQLMEIVNELRSDIVEKKERYITLYDRSFSNPLSNRELKEMTDLSQYFTFLTSFAKKLSKVIENSRN